MLDKYCIDLANYERFPTQMVRIGELKLGAGYPIVLQSMCNTDTLDTEATVAQCKKAFDAGADMMRVTASGEKEAFALEILRSRLIKDGYENPLIADVHFNPKAAEIAAEFVEKVRINPGNYIDKRKPAEAAKLSNAEYNAELSRMHERLLPLISICKKNGTAIRIGSNYGSLSQRIISRYGNTPEGMVEAAMEFYHIFRKEDFTQLVLSMKASHPRIMAQACRLLNSLMIQEGMVFPQHLGVTEAGEGVEGRLRSALGLGAVLSDGIGDTLRVSLTEEPEKEIPVAKQIIRILDKKPGAGVQNMPLYHPFLEDGAGRDSLPERFRKMPLIADLRAFSQLDNRLMEVLNFTFDADNQMWRLGLRSPDFLCLTRKNAPNKQVEAGVICPNEPAIASWCHIPLVNDYQQILHKGKDFGMEVHYDDLNASQLQVLCEQAKPLFILKTSSLHMVGEVRSFLYRLGRFAGKVPVVLSVSHAFSEENMMETAAELGAVLTDNHVAALMYAPDSLKQAKSLNAIFFDILQAAGLRRTRSEFISCPGCGRTKFDLQATTKKVKTAFGHLAGLKIAVMGCVVNGPGEMADADYGYIGAGNGRVHIYKGQKEMRRNIPETQAVEVMAELIKKNNDWKELV